MEKVLKESSLRVFQVVPLTMALFSAILSCLLVQRYGFGFTALPLIFMFFIFVACCTLFFQKEFCNRCVEQSSKWLLIGDIAAIFVMPYLCIIFMTLVAAALCGYMGQYETGERFFQFSKSAGLRIFKETSTACMADMYRPRSKNFQAVAATVCKVYGPQSDEYQTFITKKPIDDRPSAAQYGPPK